MTVIYIICEGPTEVRFVKNVLALELGRRQVFLHPVTIGSQRKKGGNVTFDRLSRNIRNQLLNNRRAYCSAFIDYYGLPSDFPGKHSASTKQALSEKADTVCNELMIRLEHRIESAPLQRFIPYVQMHEFEGLLFSHPATFATSIGLPELRSDFAEIRNEFETPEHINDSSVTAPSKRILELAPGYEKPLMGVIAATAIGLDRIRQECPLFSAWLATLESLPPPA